VQVWCSNCWRVKDITPQTVNAVLRVEGFQCGNCGITHYKLEKELPCVRRQPYFSTEEEVRCVWMNALFNRGVNIWDCRAEKTKCRDPVIFEGIPVIPIGGDFPFFYNGRFWVVEMKFVKYRCRIFRGEEFFKAARSSPRVEKNQSDLMLNGGGLLIIVAEPLFSLIGEPPITSVRRINCERLLLKKLRNKLATSEVSYTVYILNQADYKLLWNKYLKNIDWQRAEERGRERLRKKIDLWMLRQFAPNIEVQVPMRKFLDGSIADLILEKIH